jgi:DNA-binding NarL/FixJ family response regulator
MDIVIADDSAMIRERLVRMLSEVEGVSIIGQAEDGEAALEEILKHRPELVILDIRMPKANGIEVLERIKTELPDTSVIMLTAFPYPPYKEKSLAAGADYFLDKANEFEAVREIIEGFGKS